MNKMSVLMVGTGEYTTGFVAGAVAASDKKAGIVGVTLFDLRRRGLVDRLSILHEPAEVTTRYVPGLGGKVERHKLLLNRTSH